MMVGGELGVATWNELHPGPPGHVPAPAVTLLVPLGSTEQHGPHLPLDTDTRVAQALARALAERSDPTGSDDCWRVAPAIAYGASGEHQSFAGTISIGTEVLTQLLLEYGRSACCWASRVIFVNGHGGNVTALMSATARLRSEGREVAWIPCSVADSDAHAGHTETSLLLHLSPETVRFDRAEAGNTSPLAQLLPTLRTGGVAAVTGVGVLGDPTTATAHHGKRMFAQMVATAGAAVDAWDPGPHGMLR